MIETTPTRGYYSYLNNYALNMGTSKNKKQILKDMKGEINSNINILGVFNTSLTLIDRSFRQKNQQRNSSLK